MHPSRLMLLLLGVAFLPSSVCIGQTIASVCPDDPETFVSNTATTTKDVRIRRPVFRSAWQKNYPTLLYDAAQGRRYWVEYKNDGAVLLPLTTAFAPVTYTSEKILVRVCGLHFHSQVTAAAVTQAVPDGGPQIQDVPVTLTPTALQDLTKEMATADEKLSEHIDLGLLSPSRPPTVQDPCAELKQRMREASEADHDFKNALVDMQRIATAIHAGFVDRAAFSYQSLEDRTREVLASQKVILRSGSRYTDLTTFETSLVNTTGNLKQLNDAVNSYNAGITSKSFKDGWTKLTKAFATANAVYTELARVEADLRAKSDHNTDARRCLIEMQTDWVPVLKIDLDQFGELRTSYVTPYEHFAAAEINLIQSFDALNRWYAGSSISVTRYLDPVANNSLTQIAISVSDPWTPLETPGFVAVQELKVNNPDSGPQKPATVAVTDASGHTSTVSIQAGEAPNNPSAKVDIVLAPQTAAKPQVTTNVEPSITVSIVAPLGKKAAASDKPADTASAASTADTGVKSKQSIPDTSTFLERHRWINFVPTGGLLVSRFTQQTYNTETLPISTITTITVVSNPTSTPPGVTITPGAGTATYAYGSSNGAFQQTAVAGFTWYPLGRDTYPIFGFSRGGHPSAAIYAQHEFLSRTGLFLGTSVTSLGTFTTGPSFEMYPGIQLFAGVALQQRNYLAQNIVLCSTLGPSVSTTSNTSTATSGTGVTTTTTATVQTNGGCASPNVTVLTGSTVPTSTELKPAFSFGIMLNTNLIKTLNLH